MPKMKYYNGTTWVVLDSDTVDGAHLSTDTTLTSNSDTLIPSEKAVKTYVDNKLMNTKRKLRMGVRV